MSKKKEKTCSGLLSILIPVYNERAYLHRCIARVMAAPLPRGLERELIMVDDASTDGTTDLVKALAEKHPGIIRAFYQQENRGKGAAIQRAIKEMRGQYAIFQDADLEYEPNEYSVVLKPLLDGYADVVYGSRFASRTMRRVLNYHHTLGNLFLTHFSNATTGLNLTDMETCYKAFRADILKTIPLRSNRFGIEPEITAKVAKRNYIVYEVPISYHGRDYSEGKKIGWKDGVSAIYTIMKYWLIDDCYEERYGHQILADLSLSQRFNRWIAKAIEPYLGQRILELGSGLGNISHHLPKRERLTVSDIDETYISLLADAYRDNALVKVVKLDLNSDADFEGLGEKYDTVVCLNVLEHIADEEAALRRIHSVLEPQGRLVLLVPQYEWLYGSYDQELGHFRRYERTDLEKKIEDSGFTIKDMKSFNSLAILGWGVNSRLMKRKNMGKVQLKLFDMMVPMLKPLEGVLPLPGLSLACVAEARK